MCYIFGHNKCFTVLNVPHDYTRSAKNKESYVRVLRLFTYGAGKQGNTLVVEYWLTNQSSLGRITIPCSSTDIV